MLADRGCRSWQTGYKAVVSPKVLDSLPERVTVPYAKADCQPAEYLSTTGHANPVGNWEVHSPKAKYI